jgi:hypothetical protein
MHMVLLRHENVPLFCMKTKTINKHLFSTFINYIRNILFQSHEFLLELSRDILRLQEMCVPVKLVGHSCSGMQLLILQKMKQVEEVLLLKTSIMWVRY